MRFARLLSFAIPSLFLACGGGGGTTPAPAPPADALTLHLDAPGVVIPKTLLGLNAPWEDAGHFIARGGEQVQDRSFRSLGAAGSPWSIQGGAGTVAYQSSGGVSARSGEQAYPGCAVLTGGPGALDLVGVSQVLLGAVTAGTTYTLDCATAAEGPETPALYAGLAQVSPFIPLAVTQYQATQVGTWIHHRFAFTPTQDCAQARLSLGIVGPGRIRLDEVRFSARPDGLPAVDPLIRTRLQTLGASGLRWPGGTLVDTFDWKASIGTTRQRGETLALFGKRQTPALGLDEVLRLCEDLGLEPLVQVNILAGPSEAADLVAYCNAGATTPMGLLRAANGHPAPYGVKRFELGNEPSFAYGGGDHAGASYANLAAPVATAMKAVDPSIRLSGALEASFLLAGWRTTVPLLVNWNGEALALEPQLDFVHGHYYSYFDSDPDETTRFQHLMAGGTVLRQTARSLAATTSRPLWITEYHVALETAGALDPARLVDGASGLGFADQLMAMMQGGFDGACAFNLAEPAGYGILAPTGPWNLRPAGLALQLLSPFAGEALRPASLGVPTVALGPGKGNIPTGTTYATLSLLATRTASGGTRLALLNRSASQSFTVRLGLSGPAKLTWLRPAHLSDHNEGALTVTLRVEDQTFSADADWVTLPPASLLRVDR